jgi:hypothetical protein
VKCFDHVWLLVLSIGYLYKRKIVLLSPQQDYFPFSPLYFLFRGKLAVFYFFQHSLFVYRSNRSRLISVGVVT